MLWQLALLSGSPAASPVTHADRSLSGRRCTQIDAKTEEGHTTHLRFVSTTNGASLQPLLRGGEASHGEIDKRRNSRLGSTGLRTQTAHRECLQLRLHALLCCLYNSIAVVAAVPQSEVQ